VWVTVCRWLSRNPRVFKTVLMNTNTLCTPFKMFVCVYLSFNKILGSFLEDYSSISVIPNMEPSAIAAGDDRGIYDQILLDIVTYVFHFEVTSPRAWERARIALLDSLGCAMESLAISPECVKLLGPVVPKTIVPNGFRLPGTSFQLDPVKGAFDLGTMIRYLDHNDAYPGAEWGHPSDNLGALIAVSDWLSRLADPAHTGPPLTLRSLLTAQIKAYEIQGCFQIRNAFNAVGLDHTILIKVASTALISWLLGLSESQTLAALSQAWQDGHPLRTFRQAPNTGPRKGWAAGDACMRAMHLALLTRTGQPGAPKVLTAPRWGFYAAMFGDKEFVLPRPYGSWVMESVFFKLIPAEGHGISAVEATIQLAGMMAQQGLSAESDIEKVLIRTQAAACTIIDKKGHLYNAADRDHCMQYMLAVVLLKGRVIETSDYHDESPWASDPRVDALREKMHIVEDEQFTRDYHDQKVRSGASGVKIITKDGAQLEEVVVEFPFGHPKRPDTLRKVKEKFRRNMGLIFEDNKAEEVLKAVEIDDMAVHEFIDLLSKAEKF